MDSTYNKLRSFSGMASPKADMVMYTRPTAAINPYYDYYDYNDYNVYNSAQSGKDYTFLGKDKYIEQDADGATYISQLNPQTPEDTPQRAIVSGPMSTTLPYAVNGNKVSLYNNDFKYNDHNIRTVIPVGNDAKWENIQHRVKSGPMSTTIPAYAKPQAIQTPKPVKKSEPVKTATLNLTPKAVPSWVEEDDRIKAKYANMRPVENTAPVVNTPKPVQKNTRPVYMPMSTDQAVELYRKQRYKNY